MFMYQQDYIDLQACSILKASIIHQMFTFKISNQCISCTSNEHISTHAPQWTVCKHYDWDIV